MTMQDNTAQIEFWNGEAGQRWADDDLRFEHSIGALTEPLLERARGANARRALDIGCGCGNQTLALAQMLGTEAEVTGIDISEPMLSVARRRNATNAAKLHFLRADAATHRFEPQSFDLLFSRFGVMFFSEPAAAFANLRNACIDGARLVFCCWQDLRHNDWLRVPMQALARHIDMPAADPHAPGPFAFGDRARVQRILDDAGFCNVQFEELRIALDFAQGETLEQAAAALVESGPGAALFAQLDPQAREQVLTEVGTAVAPHFHAGHVRMPSAIWLVSAASSPHRPSSSPGTKRL